MAKSGARRARQKPAPDVSARLERAVSLHKQGKWKQAEPLYRKIVKQAPNNFIALHLLGVVALEREKYEDAEELISKALDLNPDYPEALNNLGNVYLKLERYDEAMESYEKALELKPDSYDAANNFGNALFALGRYEEALDRYDRALAIRSDFVDAQFNRGNALNAMGRWEDALACYDNALAVRPKYAEAHFNRGLVLKELDRLEEALASFDVALSLDRQYANACRRRGQVLVALERWPEALANADRLLTLAPEETGGFRDRGTALYRLGRWDEALDAFEALLSLDPADAEALTNRGSALRALGRLEDALEDYDRALTIRPDYAEALSNRGNVLADLGRWDEALASYDEALALDPQYADALSNRGNCLKYMGRTEDALACFERARAIAPDDPMIRYNEGLCRLLTGDFERGWPEYEYRWPALELGGSRTLAPQRWTGREPLDGKTILLHAEQGLGDTIQFCRFAPMVAARGARVTLEVQPPLKELLSGLPGVERIIARGEAVPDTDFQCPLLSLPGAFDIGPDTVPADVPYLTAEPAIVARWSDRLGKPGRPRIGIAWAGTTRNTDNKLRSLPLSALAPLLAKDAEFFSLHHEIGPEDEAVLADHPNLAHFGGDIANFVDTAALVSLMDAVVSVDTSLAHLAAALGRPTRVLLSRVPDWRWMLDREDSPWYPSVRLFRQQMQGDWEPVIQRVCDTLDEALAGNG